jgi:hypothetical protein
VLPLNVPERKDRATGFFAAGLIASLCCIAAQLYWWQMFRVLYRDPTLNFTTATPTLQVAHEVIGYIPYLIGAVLVVVAHFVREDALNPVAYFGGALSVPVLAIAFLLVWFIADGMFRTTTFNSPVWKTNSTADTDWPARLRMVDDLLNKHVSTAGEGQK